MAALPEIEIWMIFSLRLEEKSESAAMSLVGVLPL